MCDVTSLPACLAVCVCGQVNCPLFTTQDAGRFNVRVVHAAGCER